MEGVYSCDSSLLSMEREVPNSRSTANSRFLSPAIIAKVDDMVSEEKKVFEKNNPAPTPHSNEAGRRVFCNYSIIYLRMNTTASTYMSGEILFVLPESR